MDRKAWIVITLCVIGMVLNGWYMAKHPPQPSPEPVASQAAPNTSPASAPSAQPVSSAPTADTNSAQPQVPTTAVEEVVLSNSKAAYTFTTQGGGIKIAELHDTKDTVIINEQGKAAIGSFGSAPRTYDDLVYKIVDKSDKHVVFEATSPEQILIRKEYRFSEGKGSNEHLLELHIQLTNKGQTNHVRDNYYLYTGAAMSLRPDEVEVPAFVWNTAGSSVSFTTNKFRDGPGMFGFGSPIRELPYERFELLRWGGVMSRFFTTLITTAEDYTARAWGERFLVDHSKDQFSGHSKAGNDYAIHGGVSLPQVTLNPGHQKDYKFRIYIGPKIFHDLNKIDTEGGREGPPDRQMRQVMFYGTFLTFISRILVSGLRVFHDWTGNWGVAIILLTICVRSVLWPIQARSNRTMKRMGLLSPKLKELQEKYKDEPQKLNTEMMKLYREYGVNPLGGCLPLLIQIPIFFGFYAVLRYAAELRSQPFLWVNDLSMPDTVANVFGLPVNPLPLLMAVTMFLQMKLTPQPATADKMQQRIFMFMPFIFLFFCYNFASALALYWTAQNIYSIFQAQISRLWQTDPVLEKVAPAGNANGGPSQKKKYNPPHLGGGRGNSSRKK